MAKTSPPNMLVVYGNLTADPTVEAMPNGTKVVNFHVSEDYGRGVNFFKCVLVGDRAEKFAAQYRSGDHLCVTGRLVSHTHTDAQGREAVWWEVWVTSAGLSGIF